MRAKRRLANHHHIHVARRALLALRDGTENEGEPHRRAKRLQGLAQHIGESRRPAENTRQLLEERARAIRLVADLVACRGAGEQTRLRKRFNLTMQRPRRYAG